MIVNEWVCACMCVCTKDWTTKFEMCKRLFVGDALGATLRSMQWKYFPTEFGAKEHNTTFFLLLPAILCVPGLVRDENESNCFSSSPFLFFVYMQHLHSQLTGTRGIPAMKMFNGILSVCFYFLMLLLIIIEIDSLLLHSWAIKKNATKILSTFSLLQLTCWLFWISNVFLNWFYDVKQINVCNLMSQCHSRCTFIYEEWKQINVFILLVVCW